MEIHENCKIPYLTSVMVMTKLGSCEIGYLSKSTNLFKTIRGLIFNPKDILAWVDITEIEDSFTNIFEKYLDNNSNLT